MIILLFQEISMQVLTTKLETKTKEKKFLEKEIFIIMHSLNYDNFIICRDFSQALTTKLLKRFLQISEIFIIQFIVFNVDQMWIRG